MKALVGESVVKKRIVFMAALFVFLIAFPRFGAPARTSAKAGSGSATGICVYYSDKFQGHILASGEKYDKNALAGA